MFMIVLWQNVESMTEMSGYLQDSNRYHQMICQTEKIHAYLLFSKARKRSTNARNVGFRRRDMCVCQHKSCRISRQYRFRKCYLLKYSLLGLLECSRHQRQYNRRLCNRRQTRRFHPQTLVLCIIQLFVFIVRRLGPLTLVWTIPL